MNEVSSQCVSICDLDNNDICIGCYRTGEEIGLWTRMSRQQKTNVMEKVKQREAKSYR